MCWRGGGCQEERAQGTAGGAAAPRLARRPECPEEPTRPEDRVVRWAGPEPQRLPRRYLEFILKNSGNPCRMSGQGLA